MFCFLEKRPWRSYWAAPWITETWQPACNQPPTSGARRCQPTDSLISDRVWFVCWTRDNKVHILWVCADMRAYISRININAKEFHFWCVGHPMHCPSPPILLKINFGSCWKVWAPLLWIDLWVWLFGMPEGFQIVLVKLGWWVSIQ